MSQVNWTKTALNDADQLVEPLMDVNPEAAVRASRSIRQAGDSLGQNPKRGTMVQGAPGVRKLRVYHARQNRPI